MSDYYQLLGVSKNASANEIKEAYRKRALENHPDRLRHLGEDEIKQRGELMYDINEAWNTLSNPKNRKEYDTKSAEQQAKRAPEGARAQGRPASNQDIFSTVFGNMDIFGGDFFSGQGNWGDIFGGQQQKKKEDEFLIPETDWGLLVALKKAYESKEDGKWRVSKTEDDKRSWMPKEVYSVKKEDGEVFVFRVITDWRSEWDREKEIEATKKDDIWEKEKMKPNTFLGEYYLYGEGKNRLTESYKIPYSFGEYLQAVKSLAGKLARKETDKDGNYSISNEWRIMNRYGQFGANNTREEGKSLWKDDEDREWVRGVKFDDFWKRISQAEGSVVQVEGANKSPERQSRSRGEGSSGESRG